MRVRPKGHAQDARDQLRPQGKEHSDESNHLTPTNTIKQLRHEFEWYQRSYSNRNFIVSPNVKGQRDKQRSRVYLKLRGAFARKISDCCSSKIVNYHAYICLQPTFVFCDSGGVNSIICTELADRL